METSVMIIFIQLKPILKDFNSHTLSGKVTERTETQDDCVDCD